MGIHVLPVSYPYGFHQTEFEAMSPAKHERVLREGVTSVRNQKHGMLPTCVSGEKPNTFQMGKPVFLVHFEVDPKNKTGNTGKQSTTYT